MFELLFKYPREVFAKGRLVLLGPWPTWALWLSILAVTIVLGLIIRSRLQTATPLVRRWRAGAIWLLQSALAALLLILLWQPVILITRLKPQQDIIAVLIDDSRSMTIAENGSTRLDYTNYYETLPAEGLETALWLESDRMRSLDVSAENLKNQQNVVSEEVRSAVLNQPYGLFEWLDLWQNANQNWFNAHNFYGDLKDIEAATLPDVQTFFKTYYAPNNAALAIVGDFDPAEAKKFVEKYFGALKASELPAQPDLTEPRQEKERRATKNDALAKRPAIALGYHMPERNTPEYYAMELIDQMLIEGDDSVLHQELVQKRGITGNVNGGINLLGNPWDYKGPMLFITNFIYDPATSPETIVQAIDGAIEPLRTKAVDQKTLDRAMGKLRSDLYDTVGQFNGFGLVDLLASFALFDDDPGRVNSLVPEYQKVTPALIQKTAQEYLRPENRTVLLIQPQQQASAAPAAPAKNQ